MRSVHSLVDDFFHYVERFELITLGLTTKIADDDYSVDAAHIQTPKKIPIRTKAVVTDLKIDGVMKISIPHSIWAGLAPAAFSCFRRSSCLLIAKMT